MDIKQKLKILYAEDEPDIRLIVKTSLVSLGNFDVCECDDGRKAVQVIEDGLYQPDLIILDMMMPGLNGEKTFYELRKLKATAQTPIIFMTAKVQPNEIQQYLNIGAIGVIPKPFDPLLFPQEILKLWTNYKTASAA